MDMRNQRLLTSGAVCLAGWLGTAAAWAEEPAGGIMKHDAATGGSTDVAAEGFQAATVKPPEEKDATELKLSAGALNSTGNARSLALTGVGKFRARRGDNQLSSALAGNYSRSAPGRGEPMETSVENVQGSTRYDRFLGQGFAVFLSGSVRSDRFQGLDLRLNLDPGLAYYFVDHEKVQLWTEVGYDLQYDVRRGANIRAARADGTTLDRTDTRHSARLFGGYSNALSAAITFNTGLEYLQGLPETKYYRLNWDVGLTSSISSKLSIATTFSVRYDHHPLPDVVSTDTQTAVSLVYTLL
jgi:putative salt-induced outer membrane protein